MLSYVYSSSIPVLYYDSNGKFLMFSRFVRFNWSLRLFLKKLWMNFLDKLRLEGGKGTRELERNVEEKNGFKLKKTRKLENIPIWNAELSLLFIFLRLEEMLLLLLQGMFCFFHPWASETRELKSKIICRLLCASVWLWIRWHILSSIFFAIHK